MSQISLVNCEKTLHKLKDFLQIAERIPEEYTQAAVIQAFEFTFEVFWKTFQKMGQTQGLMIGSPKAAFSFAFQAGLINNENAWVDLLNDRNITTDAYHENISNEVFKRIRNQHIHAFEQAYTTLNTVV